MLGISYDSPASHKAFKEKYQLQFTLLSDTAKTVAAAYGAKGILFAKRKTFLIDPEGKIFKIYSDVDVSTHGSDILKAFQTR